MDEYELYALSKVPPTGIDEQELKEAGFRDIGQKLGPFSRYSDSSYARTEFTKTVERLVKNGYLVKEKATIKLSEFTQMALEHYRLASSENVEQILRDLYSKGHSLKLIILQLALEKLDRDKLVRRLVTRGWSDKAIELGLSDLAVRGLIRSPYEPEILDDLRPKVQSWVVAHAKDIVRLSTSKAKESELLYSEYPFKIGVGKKLEKNKIRDLIINIVGQCELRGMEILDIDVNRVRLALDQRSYELQYIEKLSYVPSISTDCAVWICQEIEPFFYESYCSDINFEVRKRAALFDLVKGHRLSCISDYFFNIVQEIIEKMFYGARFLCPFENINEEFTKLGGRKTAALEQELSKSLEAERTLHMHEIRSREDKIATLSQELENNRKRLQESIKREELRSAIQEQLQYVAPKEFTEKFVITLPEPLEPLERIEPHVRALIERSRQELFIFSPYLDNSLLPILIKANERGVQVRILTRPKENMTKKEQQDAISRLEQLSKERKKFMHKTSIMLHARIIGSEVEVIISSADLDSVGLLNQIQAGVYSNSPRTVYEALKLFDQVWWKKEASI